jgi:hypothetical protein
MNFLLRWRVALCCLLDLGLIVVPTVLAASLPLIWTNAAAIYYLTWQLLFGWVGFVWSYLVRSKRASFPGDPVLPPPGWPRLFILRRFWTGPIRPDRLAAAGLHHQMSRLDLVCAIVFQRRDLDDTTASILEMGAFGLWSQWFLLVLHLNSWVFLSELILVLTLDTTPAAGLYWSYLPPLLAFALGISNTLFASWKFRAVRLQELDRECSSAWGTTTTNVV